MRPRIGLIHATLNAVLPLVETFRRLEPEVELLNFLDEGLLLGINADGEIPPPVRERFESLIARAVESGVDGILLSCSAFSPVVPEIQERFPVPIVSVDRAMLEQAVAMGERIGVVATVAASGPTTAWQLAEIAAGATRAVEIQVEVVPEAFAALTRGDGPEHDRLIRERARRLAREADVVVLAQISMARARTALDDLPVPILTSPESSVRAMMAQLWR